VSQRVITIGGLGSATSTPAASTPAASTPAASTSTAPVVTTDPGNGALWLESLPMVLVWVAGAVAIGYAAVTLWDGQKTKRVRRSEPHYRRHVVHHRAHHARRR